MGYYGIKCNKNNFYYLNQFFNNLGLKQNDKGPAVYSWSDTFSKFHITRISYQPNKEYQVMLQFSNGDHTKNTSPKQKREQIEELIIKTMNTSQTTELFHMDDIKKGNVYYKLEKNKLIEIKTPKKTQIQNKPKIDPYMEKVLKEREKLLQQLN